MRLDSFRHALEVRLRCVQRAACSSFLVYLHLSQPVIAEWRPESLAERDRVSAEFLTQPGKFATLVLSDRAMRISMPVICLERGIQGQQIRVMDSASHRVFRAEVQSTGLVVAQLER
jgi:hypothetical protein